MKKVKKMSVVCNTIKADQRNLGVGGSGWWIRICGCLLLLVAAERGASSATVTFESLGLASQSYDNGDPGNLSDGQSVTDPIVAEGVAFSNTFSVASDGSYSYWYGFAGSTVVNTADPNYTNQYASYPGGGFHSSAYGIAYGDGASLMLPAPGKVLGFEIANSTYAYLAMENGDPYGFTAPLANSNGYFIVTAEGFLQGSPTSSADFYLADFRTESAPGILANWAFFDLSGLGTVDTVSFTFTGSDVGDYGLNTPAYFAMDDLVYGSVPEIDPAAAGLPLSFVIGSLAILERQRQRFATRRSLAAG